MKKHTAKIKSLTGIKNAILKHKKVWITIDDKNWVYAELRPNGSIWINYGMNDNEAAEFHAGLTEIYDFLSFKRSTDQL